jgi:thymidylate synthase (FAD)
VTDTIAQGPQLHIIARPALDSEAVSAFLQNEELAWRRTEGARDSEELVEVAGRVCYLSFGARQSPKTNAEYIRNLVDAGHESVLEHATWTFVLAGVTRAFSHQLVRHRIGFSYSQLSQQYHDERDAGAIMPEIVRKHNDLADAWRSTVARTQQTYRQLVEELSARSIELSEPERRRLLRSAARTVLPAATETKIAFTANARSLRHFLTERGNLPGDEEMRRVSVVLLEKMQDEAPALFSDFAILSAVDGFPLVSKKS